MPALPHAPRGPSILLQCYWTALKTTLLAVSAARPATGLAEAEVLIEVAHDLLETAERLRVRALEVAQESLPLGLGTPALTAEGHQVSAFKRRFPEIPEERSDEVLFAYELITRLVPSIILFPELLLAEIRIQLALGVVGLDRALALVEFERQLHVDSRASP